MAYTNLEKFHFWCQKVLPLVYDDSLSYYEVLCKVTSYLNKTIEAVNDLAGTITNYDELINNLNSVYEGLQTDLTALKKTVNDNYDTLNSALETAISNADASIEALRASLQTQIDANGVSIDTINATIAILKSADATLQDEIDKLSNTVDLNYADLDTKITVLSQEVHNGSVLAELRTMIKELQDKMNNLTYDIYNYVLDKRVSFDYNNYVIYEHMGNALTSQQYCELGLTADEYAQYQIRAIDYLKFSRDLLHYDWVYLPITGGKQSHSVALDQIANYVYRTLSSDDYKALDLDADAYSELGLSAFQYLYYPMTDASEFTPSSELNGLITDLISRVTDVSNRMDNIEELHQGALYVSDEGTGITAENYAKLKFSE